MLGQSASSVPVVRGGRCGSVPVVGGVVNVVCVAVIMFLLRQ